VESRDAFASGTAASSTAAAGTAAWSTAEGWILADRSVREEHRGPNRLLNLDSSVGAGYRSRALRDLIIGVIIIVFCLGSTTALVLYSRRLIHRISRMKSSTYRDIVQDRHG
jgi:Na+/proline symporter